MPKLKQTSLVASTATTTSQSPACVLYIPKVISRDLSKRAFDYIDTAELNWYGPRSRTGVVKQKESRASFGRHDFDPQVPDLFQEIGMRAVEAIQKIQGRHTDDLNKFYTESILNNMILNLYDPGDSIAPHQDPPRQNPAVLGITFCENADTSRTMRFTKVDDKSRKHPIITHDGSVYLFWGDAYSHWKHESMGSKRQKGRVLSATFRAQRVV